MARGDNFRGRRPKGSGRKKGQTNHVTQDVRAAIAQIAQGNIDAFGEWMLAIEDPARRCEVFLKVLAYHIPPLARVETSLTMKRSLQDLSDDELLALVGDQPAGTDNAH